MSLRARWIAERPDFPWLDAADPAGVERFLAARGWIAVGERVQRCERAGDGNMNLTLRVYTDRRRVVLKQARPWVEKYDHIAAPWDRSTSEQRFYERVAGIPAVAGRMPALLGSDPAAHALLLEDLAGARDLTGLYAGEPLGPGEAAALADYLRALHQGTAGPPAAAVANRAMRALNHEHCFVVPFAGGSGLGLDRFEPGLERLAAEVAGDATLRVHVDDLGRRYLADGTCLVHADYFPGSWLRTEAGVRIIDPEFSFHGEPELDVGGAVAHLVLAARSEGEVRGFVASYGPCDSTLVAGYAAVEVLRRLLGVAQLPLAPSHGARAALVARARAAAVGGSLDAFWR